jgi:hypothetical protein
LVFNRTNQCRVWTEPDSGRKPGAVVVATSEHARRLATDGGFLPLEVLIKTMRLLWAKAEEDKDEAARIGRLHAGEGGKEPLGPAMWLRTFDEANHNRHHPIISPEGELMDLAHNAS